MGTNQLACGDEAGSWRLNRANHLDQSADTIVSQQSTIINLNNEIESLRAKMKKTASDTADEIAKLRATISKLKSKN